MKRFPASVWTRIAKVAGLRSVFLLARFCFGSFIFSTAFYCLLFYIPFSRHTLFDWHVVPALSVLAKYHAVLYWLVLLPACLTLVSNLQKPALRRLTIGFFLVSAVTGVCVSLRPLLPNLPPDERSLIWSLVSLFPLLWIAIIDWRAAGRLKTSSIDRTRVLRFRDIVAIAAFIAILYQAIFAMRYVVTGAASFTGYELVLFAMSSFGWHFALFGLVFSAFKFVNGLSAKLSHCLKLAFVFRSALVALALMLVLRKVVFAAVSFNDRMADFSAFALSCSFVAYLASSLIGVRSIESSRTRRHWLARFCQLSKTRRFRYFAAMFCIGVIGVFAYVTLVNLQGVDWNGLLQKFSVLLVWVATFVLARALRRRPVQSYSFAAVCLLFLGSVGLYFGVQAFRPAMMKALNRRAPAVTLLVERYADYDPSFSVASEILAPATVDAFQGTADDPFFAMLRQNSNIPPEVKVDPVEVSMAETSDPTPGRKPHIFVFVIDSLRQDYLSPYNSSVHFTPAIENFAHESVVMKNVFTRYGGTSLAEASIWTGGMQLHKQFVQPFYPMNSLQKLLDADRYQAFITVDPILKSLLKPSANIVELDRDIDWKDYDLVRTLSELQNKLTTAAPAKTPIFVYSQPQNIHLVSLKVSTRQPSADKNHTGFAAQHAFEVERMDKAFGEFVVFLKSSGLYDNSIIVLTADHGDSLGEDGHWGHGNSIYPEVIRIPLIIHLPSSLQRKLVWDPNSIAFSTDITPTLYYLLGHRPVTNNQMFGRPLFTSTMQEQEAYKRDSYLIADSYGPVYGLLRDNGRSLFVADAAKNRAYVYDLTRGYGGRRVNVTDELTTECEKLIALDVQRIQTFYNFQPTQQTAVNRSPQNTIAQLYSLLFSR
jgi:hypothetical protein